MKDGGILIETPAILAFIAQSYPHKRLTPLRRRHGDQACASSY
jgi:hypothetical protein